LKKSITKEKKRGWGELVERLKVKTLSLGPSSTHTKKVTLKVMRVERLPAVKGARPLVQSPAPEKRKKKVMCICVKTERRKYQATSF
jgi:hypothetical protein